MSDQTYAYDPEWVARYFDAYGVLEWERMVRSPGEEVKLAVHIHLLKEHIRKGMKVLEVGAGAGRFTQILVELGARVHVADISQGQLDLNRGYADAHGFAHGVEAWQRLDMCAMPEVPSQGFDAVVCYGGPLSYVFEQRDAALRELTRVAKPGSPILLSVMSLWGSAHYLLPLVMGLPVEENRQIIATGDLSPVISPSMTHFCHMFRVDEFRDLLLSHNLEILALAASNCVSSVWAEPLEEIRQDPIKWESLLQMEIEACQQPGCLDMGTHLIAIVRGAGVSPANRNCG